MFRLDSLLLVFLIIGTMGITQNNCQSNEYRTIQLYSHSEDQQQLFILGNIPELGSWDLTNSLKMKSNRNLNNWFIDISLPTNCLIEYKFIQNQNTTGPILRLFLSPENLNVDPEVSIMTFNIRMDTSSDGVNQWAYRKEQVVEVMNRYACDFIGAQEVEQHQMQYLDNSLLSYSFFGRGRGKQFWDDEGCPIFYNPLKWIILESEVFWLSDTPYEPGSATYGNVIPRICTFIKFQNKETDFITNVYNCHLDHISEISRQKSGIQIKQHMNERVKNESIIIMGDLNVPPDSPTLVTLENELFPLIQTMSENDKKYATFHDFTGEQINQENHIDFILYNQGTTTKYQIIHDNNKGFYPSDHFPLMSQIRF